MGSLRSRWLKAGLLAATAFAGPSGARAHDLVSPAGRMLPVMAGGSVGLAGQASVEPVRSRSDNCKSRLAELSHRKDVIGNPRLRELFLFDLTRASKELAEGDEDECTEALDHATQLLEMK